MASQPWSPFYESETNKVKNNIKIEVLYLTSTVVLYRGKISEMKLDIKPF